MIFDIKDEQGIAEFAENIRRAYSLGWLSGFLFGCLISAALTYAAVRVL